MAELCVVAGDPDVTRHRQLAPAPQRKAVDRREHRLAGRLQPPEHRLPALRARLAVERTLFREITDIGPRHERLGASPGQDRALDHILRRDALGNIRQLEHHKIIQGVQLVGAIDGNERDAVADLE